MEENKQYSDNTAKARKKVELMSDLNRTLEGTKYEILPGPIHVGDRDVDADLVLLQHDELVLKCYISVAENIDESGRKKL